MMKRVIYFGVLFSVGLVLGVSAWYGIVVWRQSRLLPEVPTWWYIEPPEDYFYLKDKQQNEAALWLQSMPYPKSYLELLEESPYTFDEWIERGKEIEHLEDTLLALTESGYQPLLRGSLLEAFYSYGTEKSAAYFRETLIKRPLSPEQEEDFYRIVSYILKDETAFASFKRDVLNEKQANRTGRTDMDDMDEVDRVD